MTKAVSKREIGFIKAVFLSCGHRHSLLNFTSNGVNSPSPPILLGLSGHKNRDIYKTLWTYGASSPRIVPEDSAWQVDGLLHVGLGLEEANPVFG